MQVVKGTDACTVTASRLLNQSGRVSRKNYADKPFRCIWWGEYMTHGASSGHSYSTFSIWFAAEAENLETLPMPEEIKEAEMDELLIIIGD